MAMKQFLMGAEVEYSMSVPAQQASRRGELHNMLLAAICQRHASLPDVRAPTGVYLDNGSRYYLDSGYHNEFSSPELSTPRQVAVYDRAAEEILLQAKADVKEQHRGLDVCLTKNNVNFSMPDRAAWGQHEAYMCWVPLESAAAQLIPHLVSRVPYAGAGCLTGFAKGNGFELSQRARHMTRLTGRETTHQRAIFCTRAWKPSDVSASGWTRTNLISKDSQRCSFGMYLTYGVTSLLLMIMNEGHKLGQNVQLKNAVAAMRAFSLDPLMKARVRLASGKLITAIDIQRSYMQEARPHVESGKYPDWTYEVLQHWSEVLDQLASNPLELADRLDPYVKLSIFHRQLKRAGSNWKMLRTALQTLERMRGAAPEPVVRAVVHESSQGLAPEMAPLYDEIAKREKLTAKTREHLQFAVRLQALELNYHELGGLFDQLSAAGQIDPVVVTPEEVRAAMHNPPPGGRAEQRSKSIMEASGRGWVCDWQYVINQNDNKWVDLRDPFVSDSRVTTLSPDFPLERRREIDELLVRIAT